MIPLDRVRELLSLAPGPHGGTLLDTSFVHDLARDVLSLADALATAERERDEARAERDKAKDTAHCAVVEWYAISQERDRNWTRYQRADDERLSTARRLRTAEAARDAALASADLSARAAVDAARELGHVAAAAVGERDTARSALDGLVAAVRTEREARDVLLCALQDADNDGATPDRQRDARVAYCAADRAMRAATEHLDALLSAAPAPTTVPAPLVRAYLAAEETMRLVAADDHRRDTYHEWAKRHGAAMDAVDAARAALVAGVARCAP